MGDKTVLQKENIKKVKNDLKHGNGWLATEVGNRATYLPGATGREKWNKIRPTSEMFAR